LKDKDNDAIKAKKDALTKASQNIAMRLSKSSKRTRKENW
jgi:hypothetical protein